MTQQDQLKLDLSIHALLISMSEYLIPVLYYNVCFIEFIYHDLKISVIGKFD